MCKEQEEYALEYKNLSRDKARSECHLVCLSKKSTRDHTHSDDGRDGSSQHSSLVLGNQARRAGLSQGFHKSRSFRSWRIPTRGCSCREKQAIGKRGEKQRSESLGSSSTDTTIGLARARWAEHLQRADRARLEPTGNAVEVKYVPTATPRNRVTRIIGEARICGWCAQQRERSGVSGCVPWGDQRPGKGWFCHNATYWLGPRWTAHTACCGKWRTCLQAERDA